MKKIIAILLLAALLLGAVPVFAQGARIRVEVTASKDHVNVGDTVEFVLTVEAENLVAMQFELHMPEGLSYVPGSGATPKGLASQLGVAAADWTEASMMYTSYNDVGVNIGKGTELLRFSCVAEKPGDWNVILFELWPFDGEFNAFTPEVSIQTLHVNGNQTPVTTQPVVTEPAVTEPAVTVPEHTEPSQSEPVTQPEPDTPVSNVTEPTVEVTAPVVDVTAPTEALPHATAPTEPMTPPDAPQETQPQGETLPAQPPEDGAGELPEEDVPEIDLQTKPGEDVEGEGVTQAGGDSTITIGAIDPEEQEKPRKVWPWIIAGAAALAAGAAAVVLILKKKGKAQP